MPRLFPLPDLVRLALNDRVVTEREADRILSEAKEAPPAETVEAAKILQAALAGDGVDASMTARSAAVKVLGALQGPDLSPPAPGPRGPSSMLAARVSDPQAQPASSEVRIDGVPVPARKLGVTVAKAVTARVDRDLLKHDWFAERWGLRAKAALPRVEAFALKGLAGHGPLGELRQKYGAENVRMVVTGGVGAHEEILFRVDRPGLDKWFAAGSDGNLHKFKGNKDPILAEARVDDVGGIDLSFPDEIKVRRYPVQSTYDVGDSIDVVVTDNSATDLLNAGMPFRTRGRVVEGTIEAYTPDGRYRVSTTNADGEREVRYEKLDQLRKWNHPHLFSERASNVRDMDIDLDTDAALKGFLDGAQPLIDRYLPRDGSLLSLTPAQLAKKQLACVEALRLYCADKVKYPEPDDDAYRTYENTARFPLGDLVKLGVGKCRHQAILSHLLLQRAGIDSRLASGAANTGHGTFRGFHLWLELNVADGQRYMSDQTWNDGLIALWDGAYDADPRRLEMGKKTAHFDNNLVA